MPAKRVATFLENLRNRGLLDAPQLRELELLALSAGNDPAPLARETVRRGWLTHEQVAQASIEPATAGADPGARRQRRKLVVAGGLLGLLGTLMAAGVAYFALGGPANPDPAGEDGRMAQGPPAAAHPEGSEPELMPWPRWEVLHEPREAPPAVVNPEPEANPVKQAEPEPKPVPPPAPPRKKVRAPDKATQDKLREAMQEQYKNDYAAARRKPVDARRLAGRLVLDSQNVDIDPAKQYVLLAEAADLSAQNGDLLLAMQIIEELDRGFECQLLRMKTAALTRAAKVPGDAAAAQTILQNCLLLIPTALDADNYPEANELTRLATDAGPRTRDNAARNLVQVLAREVKYLSDEFGKVKWTAEALRNRPDDLKANTAWGRYLCFVKGNWDKGLPFLARGGDKTLKNLALKDQAAPAEPALQYTLGLGWEETAAKESGPARKRVLARARFWLEKAAAKLEGNPRKEAERHLEAVNTILNTDEDTLRAQLLSALQQAAVSAPRMPSVNPSAQMQAQMQQQLADYMQMVSQMMADHEQKMQEAAKERQKQLQQTYNDHMQRGNQLLGAGQARKAAQEFNAALSIVPNDPAAKAGLRQAQQAMIPKK